MQRQKILRSPRTKLSRAKKGPEKLTVAEYLLKRLFDGGVKHLISIDHKDLTSLNSYAGSERIHAATAISAIQMGDGYAKAIGFSACAITKETPGFVDAIVRAHEEQVPQVIIVGAHHETIESLDYIESGLRELTAAWTIIDEPKLAAKKIDRALDCCMHFKQPVVIELPEDVARTLISPHTPEESHLPDIYRKKTSRNKAKQTHHKLLGIIDSELQKHYVAVVCSQELTQQFKALEQPTRFISTHILHTPSYPLEAALGVSFAKPDESILLFVTEGELHHSFTALSRALHLKKHIIIILLTDKNTLQERYSESNYSNWSLTEFAHLFVDGNAIHVQTPKAFEAALHQAIGASDGLFLIETSFST
jgi:thiamine pyrophosphate-dependent acetolactate synthase large subunit-like protein